MSHLNQYKLISAYKQANVAFSVLRNQSNKISINHVRLEIFNKQIIKCKALNYKQTKKYSKYSKKENKLQTITERTM